MEGKVVRGKFSVRQCHTVDILDCHVVWEVCQNGAWVERGQVESDACHEVAIKIPCHKDVVGRV